MIENLKFFTGFEGQASTVLDSDGVHRGTIYFKKNSVGLYDSLTFITLEEIYVENRGVVLSAPTATLNYKIENFNKNSYEHFFLYDFELADDTNEFDLYSIERAQVYGVDRSVKKTIKVNTKYNDVLLDSTGVKTLSNDREYYVDSNIDLNVDAIHIAAYSNEEGQRVGALIIYDESGNLVAVFNLYAEFEAEDERLKVGLENLGYTLPQEDSFIFKKSDVNENSVNWLLLNEKRKELLLEGHNIKPYIGTYKAIANAIKFYGYDDLKLKEYWADVSSGKYISKEVNYYNNDNELILPNKNLKKTGLFSLAYRINEVNGSFDEYDIPKVDENSPYTMEEVLIKLYGLKKRLQQTYIPLNAKILDIHAEGDYFGQVNQVIWNNQNIIQDINAGENVDFEIFPDNRSYIEDLRNISPNFATNWDYYTPINKNENALRRSLLNKEYLNAVILNHNLGENFSYPGKMIEHSDNEESNEYWFINNKTKEDYKLLFASDIRNEFTSNLKPFISKFNIEPGDKFRVTFDIKVITKNGNRRKVKDTDILKFGFSEGSLDLIESNDIIINEYDFVNYKFEHKFNSKNPQFYFYIKTNLSVIVKNIQFERVEAVEEDIDVLYKNFVEFYDNYYISPKKTHPTLSRMPIGSPISLSATTLTDEWDILTMSWNDLEKSSNIDKSKFSEIYFDKASDDYNKFEYTTGVFVDKFNKNQLEKLPVQYISTAKSNTWNDYISLIKKYTNDYQKYLDSLKKSKMFYSWDNIWKRDVSEIEWNIKGPNGYEVNFIGNIEKYRHSIFILPYVGEYKIKMSLINLYNVRSNSITKTLNVYNKNLELTGVTRWIYDSYTWLDNENTTWDNSMEWDNLKKYDNEVQDSSMPIYMGLDRGNYVHNENNGEYLSTVYYKGYTDSEGTHIIPNAIETFANKKKNDLKSVKYNGPYVWNLLKQHKWNDGSKCTWDSTEITGDSLASCLIKVDNADDYNNNVTLNPVLKFYKNSDLKYSIKLDELKLPKVVNEDSVKEFESTAGLVNKDLDFNFIIDKNADAKYGWYILITAKRLNQDFDKVVFDEDVDTIKYHNLKYKVIYTESKRNYNPTWIDSKFIKTHKEIPLLNHVSFSYEHSNVPGVVEHIWKVYNKTTGIYNKYSNSDVLTILFSERGDYEISLETKDSNGNINRTSKNVVTII